jgi:hypothetical protein
MLDTHLQALLATHADELQQMLPPHLWPLNPYEIGIYGPLTKYTLGQDGDEWLHLHHVTEADRGAPHDHPCRMVSTRIKGSYWERVFRQDGWHADILRTEGSTHVIEPDTIHLLTGLPRGAVWTLVKTGPVVREWRHYPELPGWRPLAA